MLIERQQVPQVITDQAYEGFSTQSQPVPMLNFAVFPVEIPARPGFAPNDRSAVDSEGSDFYTRDPLRRCSYQRHQRSASRPPAFSKTGSTISRQIKSTSATATNASTMRIFIRGHSTHSESQRRTIRPCTPVGLLLSACNFGQLYWSSYLGFDCSIPWTHRAKASGAKGF